MVALFFGMDPDYIGPLYPALPWLGFYSDQ